MRSVTSLFVALHYTHLHTYLLTVRRRVKCIIQNIHASLSYTQNLSVVSIILR